MVNWVRSPFLFSVIPNTETPFVSMNTDRSNMSMRYKTVVVMLKAWHKPLAHVASLES